jgi:3-methylcrotonyl-CoA carboxylase alpha subunit
LLEKYINNPRHIEVQVFADTHGNCVHLFERDCSLQRRHQKVIEEAPAPGMDMATRQIICEAAVKAARAVDYVGAGTIEFIADAAKGLRADRIWFMEMNTRLQVEHPVTEAITGQDLVSWQLLVAAGHPLPKSQDELAIDGWAIEARLYAENPAAGYLPSTGRLEHLRLPEEVRVDSGVEQGCEITAFYDPLIAKIVAHGADRQSACEKLRIACAQIEIWPVKSNAGLLTQIARDEDFRAAAVDTGFLERHGDRLLRTEPEQSIVDAAATALSRPSSSDPWRSLVGFRINGRPDSRTRVDIAGHLYWGNITPGSTPKIVAVDDATILFDEGTAWPISLPLAAAASDDAHGDGAIFSPMPGFVTTVEVVEGAKVGKGDKLLTVEAMKMEHALRAPFEGTVSHLRVGIGSAVGESQLLVTILKDGV